jgi:hypothetical protein
MRTLSTTLVASGEYLVMEPFFTAAFLDFSDVCPTAKILRRIVNYSKSGFAAH